MYLKQTGQGNSTVENFVGEVEELLSPGRLVEDGMGGISLGSGFPNLTLSMDGSHFLGSTSAAGGDPTGQQAMMRFQAQQQQHSLMPPPPPLHMQQQQHHGTTPSVTFHHATPPAPLSRPMAGGGRAGLQLDTVALKREQQDQQVAMGGGLLSSPSKDESLPPELWSGASHACSLTPALTTRPLLTLSRPCPVQRVATWRDSWLRWPAPTACSTWPAQTAPRGSSPQHQGKGAGTQCNTSRWRL